MPSPTDGGVNDDAIRDIHEELDHLPDHDRAMLERCAHALSFH